MMATTASLPFSIFVVIACVLTWVGVQGEEEKTPPECSIPLKCLPTYQRIIPQCNQKGPGFECLQKMYNDTRCKARDKILIGLERDGYDLADKVVCQKNSIRNEYKTKVHCWYGAVQCARHLAFKPAEVNPQFCDEKRLAVAGCKRDVGLPADCTSLHATFVDALLASTLCRGCSFAVPAVTVFVVALIAMLWDKTLAAMY